MAMKKQVLVAALIGIFWAAGLSLAEPTRDESSQDIRNFAHHILIHSLPFEKIRQFSSDDKAVETLSRMLEEDCGIQERLDGKDRRSPFCSTIVVMLGILGGGKSEARVDITNFIKEQDRSLKFKATKDALMALGYWISITEKKNPEDQSVNPAIDDLVSCITAAGNGTSGHNSSGKSSSDTPQHRTGNPDGTRKLCALQDNVERKHVRRSAILGLALSGSKQPKVNTTLIALLAEAEAGTSFRGLIVEALDAHNRIASRGGLACYYEKESEECQDNLKNQDGQNSGTSSSYKCQEGCEKESPQGEVKTRGRGGSGSGRR
jgi:hypothetical protein